LSPYLAIGTIIRPQGIDGEVKVRPSTDDPGRFLALETVFAGEKLRPMHVVSAIVRGGFAYLRLEGVCDRDGAEALRGEVLHVDRAHAVKGNPDGEFIADLIGCRVVDSGGGSIGELRGIQQTRAHDVYEILTTRGLLWIPALKSVVVRVDTAAGLIVLDEKRLAETSVWEDDG